MSIFTIAYTALCRRLQFSRCVTCCTPRRPSLQWGYGIYTCNMEQVTVGCSQLPVLYVCVRVTRFSWTQELMRRHLTICLSTQRMSSFPGNSSKSFGQDRTDYSHPCLLLLPHAWKQNGYGPVQEWFHKKCPRAIKYMVLFVTVTM
jgi:hypothetical protein